VVEDDDTLRETIGEVMADDGYDVRLAGDGRQALAQLDGWEPDVVVLDVMMPTMDAYGFRAAQQEAGSAAHARILVLSARPDVEAAASTIGADAWLAKPFRLEELVAVVGDLIDRRSA
jgi:two-component system, OmpR family, response regulator MprA